MLLHEYQAKEILKGAGLLVPDGVVVSSLEELDQAAQNLGDFPLVVKAQVHCGARGKAGGVKVVKTFEELHLKASELLGKVLITPQCPSGKIVNKLLIEKASKIKREIYLSISTDREISKEVLVASAEGGMEIEELAKERPEAILKLSIDPCSEVSDFQIRYLSSKLSLDFKKLKPIVNGLLAIYRKLDLSLLEINPLIEDEDGNLVLLDAKLEVDDNALFRQQEILKLEDQTQLEMLEVKAKAEKLNYVKLSGNVGCMVNGAGLAMTTMDAIKLAGANPANFLDVGGGASKEQIASAFKILTSDPDVKVIFVNIFGGILRCDRLADGLISALKELNVKLPVVVRMEGTNVEEGKAMLLNSGFEFIIVSDMMEGARRCAEIASR
ncbi:MAG: ADP-forming succinate--CoA ligase subunit beta [Aquificaceae bacterium]|nr:ADP-forming succinate--CoA ligase subunit beta [Aquificaceae bacterium]MDW8237343.1 ADP-forming succinate--CoA ligase subunit beta [Aquificaceae bacterium]